MKWKNTTDWPDWYLRRMLSWVCREIGFPVRSLKSATFGNRTNVGWSGWAYCPDEILVRVGPKSLFPVNSRVHFDGFTVGMIKDQVEALIKVTAHEIAHLDNYRRRNKSRRGGSWGGSERYTDLAAKRVLESFRKKRKELEAGWSEKPNRKKSPKKSAVEKRMENALAKEAEWETKLKRAKTALKKWKKKADYYRKTYPELLETT